MKTFKEFLQEQAEPLRREATANRERVLAWAESVERLIDQMMAWLRDADPQNFLWVDRRPVDLREEGHPAPHFPRFSRLTIMLGDRTVFVTPVIGEIVGPGILRPKDRQLRGRVDLTNGSFGFLLYGFVGPDGEESWTIVDDRTFESRPFTREAFEAALVSLLG